MTRANANITKQEAENGERTGGATLVGDVAASGYLAVKFGPPPPPPPPPTPPTPPTTPPSTPPPVGGATRLKPATSFATYENLKYSSASSRLLLDLFTPNNNVAEAPLIIYIHGGGWSSGSKDEYCLPEMYEMMKKGFAVACINYRLSKEAKFPAQIEDVKSAVRYLRANATKYKLFDDRIGVWGASAGGHLAALAGTSGGAASLDKGENLSYSSAVQAIVDMCGPTDLVKFVQTPGFTDFSKNAFVSTFLGFSPPTNPEKAAIANPISYVDANDPPFLIYHGAQDDTVPVSQSQLMHDALVAAKVSSKYTVFPYSGSGSKHAPTQFSATSTRNEITTFFDNQIR